MQGLGASINGAINGINTAVSNVMGFLGDVGSAIGGAGLMGVAITSGLTSGVTSKLFGGSFSKGFKAGFKSAVVNAAFKRVENTIKFARDFRANPGKYLVLEDVAFGLNGSEDGQLLAVNDQVGGSGASCNRSVACRAQHVPENGYVKVGFGQGAGLKGGPAGSAGLSITANVKLGGIDGFDLTIDSNVGIVAGKKQLGPGGVSSTSLLSGRPPANDFSLLGGNVSTGNTSFGGCFPFGPGCFNLEVGFDPPN